MPVHVDGRAQRVNKTKEYMELLKYVDLHPVGNWNPDTWAVVNPHPDKFQITWADPKKIGEHEFNGAKVVDPKRGHTVYSMPDKELNKTKGCVERRGMIMMEYPRPLFEAKIARMTLKSLALMDKDIQKFYDAKDGRSCEARMLGSDNKPVAQQPSLQEKRRRVTPGLAAEENEKRRSGKLREFNLAYRQYLAEQIEKGDITLDDVRRMEGIGKKEGVDYVRAVDLDDAEAAIDDGYNVEDLINANRGESEEE